MTTSSRKLSPALHSTEQENAQLRKEIDALYAAAEAREQQLLAATHAMDDILLEVESQRNALKKKNKQLLELNAYIRSINDAMNSILIVVGIDGQIAQANRVFSEDLNWTEEELPHIHVDSLFPKELLSSLQALTKPTSSSRVVSYITQHGHLEREMPLHQSDGLFTDAVYLVKGEQFYSHQGKLQGILLTATDISELRQRETALKQSEIALQKAKAEAEAANQAKGDFLANMSHEIRTPLNAIIGFTKLCLQSDLTLKQRDYLNNVDVASHSLSHLINDVLDLSKIEAGKLEMECVPFNLNQVLSNVRHVVWLDVAKRGLSLSIHIEPTLPVNLKGDPQRLQQVLVNLVGNAIKFTEKGSVSISVTPKRSRAKKSTTLIFRVTDTGIGMTDAQLNGLFHQYHQADPSTSRRFGGTGLGLTISQKLVNLMQGDIQIRSDYGKGTECEFFAKFTLLEKAEQSRSMHAETHEEFSFPQVPILKDHHVLVVDDNTINREMIRELLSSFEMSVEQVSSGEDAVEAVKRGHFSIILMDLRMTGIDGIEATKVIRTLPNGGDVPIIALSANTSASMAETCIYAGMNDYLPKPIDLKRLIQVIAHHLITAPTPNVQKIEESVLFCPDSALLRLGSNKNVYLKMLTNFLAEPESRMEELQRLYQAKDRDAQKHAFHELKGIASTLGAERLSVLCDKLERQCSEKAIDHESLTSVSLEFTKLTSAITRYLADS
ncbi:ATP-binding protein [Enterovibrio sp. ZSDZ35]|uniref:histidine kinase n=1 Tax=Enterovibrio qingdaonensis TaxID=2899818 RepID=A0ABT5QI83_9GAMM|nr:PAS domain-containing hybrid sensor histidine kinase/response regulator [Enterovibrio sp. ZSDZ35]MDD1780696.1 ATP-binding protein [Enterovibrio sp. ZSDZ35]